ncbi:MAG: 4-hydroxy-tetrahydrodipicolinate reductase [Dysgonamonadaceae bacterium]|jgi:4-hydroxy-tetrahydrodipicolinate reductase|nr:4-hydroxy-tetrahydrodipicolinate reductase [Dysgonamonadaceae bacterium]
MKIALIGYGKMGKEIEKIALERGHRIVSIIDIDSTENFNSDDFKHADVAIEFSQPASAFENYKKCFAAHVPVVSGTTGWLEHLDEVKRYCADEGQTFFYASNFSIGVNIFFAVNKYLARIMNRFPEYDVSMEEVHHIHKLDSPSGTGITLAEGILENIDRKTAWKESEDVTPEILQIRSVRRGEVPGIHEIIYESDADIISIKHDAKSRKGFALGAVVAAEFVRGKKGFLTMNDIFNF